MPSAWRSRQTATRTAPSPSCTSPGSWPSATGTWPTWPARTSTCGASSPSTAGATRWSRWPSRRPTLCRAAELEVAALLLDCLAAGFLHQLGRWDEAEARLPVDDADVWGLPAVVVRVVSGLLAVDRGRLDEAEEHLETARALGAQIHDGRINGLLARGRTELALWRGRPEDAAAAVADGLRLTSDDEMRARLCWLGLRAAADVAEQQRATTGTWDARPEAAELARLLGRLEERALGRRAPAGLGGAGRGARPERRSGHGWTVGPSRSGGPRPLGAGTASGSRPRRATAAGARPQPSCPPGAAPRRSRCGGRPGRAPRTSAPTGSARPSRRMRPGRRCPSPARARRRRTSRRSPSGSPPGSWRCWPWSRPGRTNRQIGERLFISEKTASVHVSRILAKLGARSRAQAAAMAATVGLVGPAAASPASRSDPPDAPGGRSDAPK